MIPLRRYVLTYYDKIGDRVRTVKKEFESNREARRWARKMLELSPEDIGTVSLTRPICTLRKDKGEIEEL